MKKYFLPMFLISTVIFFTNLFSQEMPLVYDVENSGVNSPVPYLPSFSELPPIQALPDPFEWSDGRGRIENFSDWEYRRNEIKAEIENYEIGMKPYEPDSINASYSEGVLTVVVFANGKTLTLTASIYLPSGSGPFPVVIGMNSGTGSLPYNIFSSRNIATIAFMHDQISTYNNPSNSDPYYKLYSPKLNIDNTGQYSAWIWGISRLIDGLELVQDQLPIDLKHLAVTGCSYAGKMALFAGAFDERIALTIAQESGGGGYTTWRFSETLGNVETLGKTSNQWFMNDLFKFSGSVTKLPYDHHELMAMVAPRALLVTGNPDYEWLADESGYVGSKAAQKVWDALGVPDRFGFSIVDGHLHCQVPSSQTPEIEAFLDKFLLGIDSVNTDISTSPYNTSLTSWINWTTPVLINDTSFFGKVNLVIPSNEEINTDTNLTFTWNTFGDADKYYIQLSSDAAFKNIIYSDSTSDTTKTIYNLLEGNKYYWRVRIKNSSGLSGPWSNQRNFSTFIPLPGATRLIGASLYRQSRPDYVIFKWEKEYYASQYQINISTLENFSGIFLNGTTSDTTITLNGTSEGIKYYWRVQTKNISGNGPWSEISTYTAILPPTNLTLKNNGANEITLSWLDNSNVEDGYIIERRRETDTVFSDIDTLIADQNSYTDKNIIQSEIFYYRVKAFKDSAVSEYSNEASYNITDIKKLNGLPTEYSLGQNYPNPFNPSTKIRFGLPQTVFTKLTVFDILGKEVKILINKELSAGFHEIRFDAGSLSNGVYLYKIQAGNFIDTKKLVLLK